MSGTDAMHGMSATRLALLARRARQERLSNLPEPIAVIGIGCRFPGGANGPRRYWSLMLEGFDAVREIPADRWSRDDWYDPDPSTAARLSVTHGGFLDDIAGFDHDFFGVPQREADRMDPHQRLALETAWEALEDAGVPAEALFEQPVGVFLASYNNDYVLHQYLRPEAINERTLTGAIHSVAANRISHFLGLHGPSITVDTACSSSLVAVHMACRSLREASCDVALAGGVSVIARPEPFIALSKAGFMAPDGRCKTFDAAADGFGRGEGGGFIVLKRLSDALAAGDRIDAVVRGSAVNQDGRSTILAAPNGRAQVSVVRDALEDGLVERSRVSFIEAHGTGTRLGDPIEVEALAEALGPPANGRRWIGAVKANIGHLEAAAGIAGLIKAVLCLRHRKIPPQQQFRQENPMLRLADNGFAVPLGETDWVGDAPLVAGVSSFGVGGTNAHVVLEESPRVPVEEAETRRSAVLCLSAASKEALAQLAQEAAAALETAEAAGATLQDVCAASLLRRTRFPHRLAAAGDTVSEVAETLRAAFDGSTPSRAHHGTLGDSDATAPGIVFVFNGQGSQWAGMGTLLAAEEPAFAATLQQIDEIFEARAGWSLRDALGGGANGLSLDDTGCAQPTIFAVQVALARLLESWGVTPSGVVGHSIGELAAAHVAGLITLEEAVEAVYQRGRIMQQAEPGGAMLAARMSEREALEVLAEEGSPQLAAINGPASVVFSGDADAIGGLATRLEAAGTQLKELAVQYGFHSKRMAPFEKELRQALPGFSPGAARCTFYSTVTGGALAAADFDPGYVARNIVSPVRLRDAIEEALADDHSIFVEVGPAPVLSAGLLETAEAVGRSVAVVPTLGSRKPGRRALLSSLGALFCHGVEPDARNAMGVPRADVALPTYPWQRVRCWLDAPERSSREGVAEEIPLLGRRLDSPTIAHPIFERWLDAASPEVRDHRIGGEVLVPAAMLIEMTRRAGEIAFGRNMTVADAQFLVPIALGDESRQMHLSIRREPGADEASVELSTRLAAGSWTLCFRARLQNTSAPPAAAPTKSVASKAIESAGRAVEPEAFYERAARSGGTFGPSYQRVRRLYVGDGEALAYLEPADALPGPTVPPAVIDSAIHPVLALLGDDSALYVPGSIEAFHGRATDCEAARVRETSSAPDGSRRFDIDLIDSDGEIVAAIRGLAMKRMPRGRVACVDPARALYGTSWDEVAVTPGDESTDDSRWVVVGDAGGLAAAWARSLSRDDKEVIFLRSDGGGGEELGGDSSRRVTTWIDCSTWALDGATNPEQVVATLAALLERAAALAGDGCVPGDRIVFVTRGATDGTGSGLPWGAACAGLVRALRREHPQATTLMIDVEAGVDVDEQALEAVLDSTADEPVVALRDGLVLAPRWERLETASASVAARDGALAAPTARTRTLELSRPGELASLVERASDRRAPQGDEVEVAVRVAALNFRDVLAGLGMVEARTSGALGHECVGVVSRVGPEVDDFRPGDRVAALAEGAFGDHVVCCSARVFAIPAELDFEDAATLPVAYLTAYHALHMVAELKEGQKVLIHAGAGGVGQAAVRLALAAGAEVFATAGTPEKRAFLTCLGVRHVADSRSLAFYDQFRQATRGAGVDVVVNSLIDDAVDRGLELLSRGGTFIELGKRDIRSPEELAAQKDIRYVAFDLFDEVDARPDRYRHAFAQIVEWIAAGRIDPLPRRRYPRARAAEALQTMSRGGHSGKIVLHVEGTVAPAIGPDATYLVTGGTGAVGLQSAEWLVDRGARHLVLASRSAPQGDAAAAITQLEQRGAEVRWVATDLTDGAAVERLVAGVRDSENPPLRGVIHAAGELDDGLLTDLRGDRLSASMGAKVLGAWNLSRALQAQELDFLLLYSAAGSALDPAGQGGYAMANALVDSFAVFLKTRGWPAASVAWGMWEGGMAGRLGAGMRQRWESRGLVPISPTDAIVMLDAVLAADRDVVVPVLIDWELYGEQMDIVDPLFTSVSAAARDDRREHDFLAEIADLPPRRRRSAVRGHLTHRLAAVLGIADEDLDDGKPFREIGLDSLMAVEYRNVLTRDFAQPLPATLTFDYPDIDALLGHLAAKIPGLGVAEPAGDAEPDPTTTARPEPATAGVTTATEQVTAAEGDEIATLSDQEAERLLLEELGLASEEATGR